MISLPAELAYDLISLVQHFRGNGQPQGFRRLEVNDKLDLRACLDGYLRRIRPFENLLYQTRRLPAS